MQHSVLKRTLEALERWRPAIARVAVSKRDAEDKVRQTIRVAPRGIHDGRRGAVDDGIKDEMLEAKVPIASRSGN